MSSKEEVTHASSAFGTMFGGSLGCAAAAVFVLFLVFCLGLGLIKVGEYQKSERQREELRISSERQRVEAAKLEADMEAAKERMKSETEHRRAEAALIAEKSKLAAIEHEKARLLAAKEKKKEDDRLALVREENEKRDAAIAAEKARLKAIEDEKARLLAIEEKKREEAEKLKMELVALPGKINLAKESLKTIEQKLKAIEIAKNRYPYTTPEPPNDYFTDKGVYVFFVMGQRLKKLEETKLEVVRLKEEVNSLESRLDYLTK